MKIAIEARALSEKSGVGTYVRNLIQQLRVIAPADQFEVLAPPTDKRLLYWWLNYTLPRQMKAMKPDVAHFTKADIPSRKIIPTVVSIHDIIPLLLPETQSPLRRLYWPSALRRAVRMSDHIITISEASKRAIVEYLGADPDHITVTPLAVDTSHFHVAGDPTSPHGYVGRSAAGLPSEAHQGRAKLGPILAKPYILFVGRWDLRKNIQSLIRAYACIAAEVPHTLVIAGHPADKSIDLKSLVHSLQLDNRVVFQQGVAYQDLPALYAGADVFVYPSVVEGWGLPPLEAMAARVPVITSNADPMDEVVGDAGSIVSFSTKNLQERLHDEGFIDRLAQEMKRLLESPTLREQLAARGVAHVRQFSWKQVAEKTLAVYKKVL